MAMKPIEILINAKDEASGVFDKLNNKLKVVGVAIAGYFGIKAFAGIVEGAAEFEGALSRVKAATGASAEEMERLKKAAQDAGANTKYTSTEAANALENLAKAGLSAGDAIETLPAVLALAQAGDVGLAESAEFVTKAVMGMGLAFTDAGRVADVLALGANATNTSVSGLAQALSYAAPVAQSAGVSLEGTVAIMGKLADAGIDASRSGTAVSNMLAQFSDPASAFKRALADAGITTNNFEEALHQLAAAGPKGEKAILAVGLNAGPALRALLNQGMPALDELKAKLEAAAGSAEATAKVMEDNLKGSMTGMASAWDTVKNVLGTPVLPVLKDGVDQLSGALRSAVADGTIQKFGEAIAAAFQAGIKWVKEFLGAIDFKKVAVDLRAFADRAGEAFKQLGEYAQNAGNIVKTAYGVMSAGTNAVLASIYGIGSVFSEMASVVMSGVAKLRDGLATITFGKLSESFKLAADDARSMAQGFGDAAQAMRDKASSALGDVADAAQMARDGFGGLVGAVQSVTPAVDASSKAIAEMARQIEDAGQKTAVAKKATEDKTAADAAASAAIAQLRQEYADLVSSGNLQAAAEKLKEIDKALQGTTASSKDAAKAAADAAAQIEAAFSRLGVTSSAALKEQATNAQRDYDIIKTAGTSTAQDIGAAFKVAAEKAIAANNGIAPSWVTAQAAARGYVLEVDAAGKTTVKSMKEAEAAVGGVAKAHTGAAGAVGSHTTAVRDLAAAYSDAGARALAAQGQFLAAAQAQKNADTGASSITKTQANTNPVDGVPTFNSKEEAEAWLQAWKAQYQRDNPFSTKRGGQLGSYMHDMTMFEYQKELDSLAIRDAMKNAAPGAGRNTSSTQTPNAGTSTTTVNITVEGTTRSINTDAQGAATLQELVRQLAQAKGTALR